MTQEENAFGLVQEGSVVIAKQREDSFAIDMASWLGILILVVLAKMTLRW